MPADLKSIAQVLRTGWKGLALADQADAEQVVEVLKEVLSGLEAIEESAEAKQ